MKNMRVFGMVYTWVPGCVKSMDSHSNATQHPNHLVRKNGFTFSLLHTPISTSMGRDNGKPAVSCGHVRLARTWPVVNLSAQQQQVLASRNLRLPEANGLVTSPLFKQPSPASEHGQIRGGKNIFYFYLLVVCSPFTTPKLLPMCNIRLLASALGKMKKAFTRSLLLLFSPLGRAYSFV